MLEKIAQNLLLRLSRDDSIFEVQIFHMGAAILHLLFCLFFLQYQEYELVWYQGIVALIYYTEARLYRRSMFIVCYLVAFVEILIQVMVVFWNLGNSCFSEMYLLFLAQLVSYIVYTNYRRGIKWLFSLMAMAGCVASYFFVALVLHRVFPGMVDQRKMELQQVFTQINIISVFAFFFVYTFFYSIKHKVFLDLLDQQNKELIANLTFDHLTKVCSRKHMDENLKKYYNEYVEQGQDLTVAMGDIDYFKKVNDTYGHEAGDLVLTGLGELFQQTIQGEHMVGRWGGEEFLFLFRGEESTARTLLEQLRQKIQECKIPIHQGEISVTMTFGCVQLRGEASIEALLRQVDHCLYEGKKQGRNRVIVSRMEEAEELALSKH